MASKSQDLGSSSRTALNKPGDFGKLVQTYGLNILTCKLRGWTVLSLSLFQM